MNELTHHGILGMKWGIRRYQNKDGTLTAEGKQRYLTNVNKYGTYDSINLDSGTRKERRAKAKERDFMRKVNKDFELMNTAAYEQFCDTWTKLTRSIDNETIDTLGKIRNHGGGDDHYMEQENFENFKNRYADCGSEAQLRKVFDYCEAVNNAGDEQNKFMLGYMTDYVEYIGFTDPAEQESVKRYLKSTYGIH